MELDPPNDSGPTPTRVRNRYRSPLRLSVRFLTGKPRTAPRDHLRGSFLHAQDEILAGAIMPCLDEGFVPEPIQPLLRSTPPNRRAIVTYCDLLGLAVVLESVPELVPRLPQAVTQKNVSVANGAVFDPETIADMTSNLTRLERALCEFAGHTYNDHRLWRRIAIPAKPMRVHPADCPRQPQRRAIQIDCASLA